MKKFSFSLQTVLNVRMITEDLAKQDLARAQQQLEIEEEKLRVMHQDWDEMCNFSGDGLEEIRHRQYYREMLKNRIEGQKSVVIQKQNSLKQARDKAIKAERDRKVLENLKDLQGKAYRQMVLAEDQKFLDEIAVLRYTGNKA